MDYYDPEVLKWVNEVRRSNGYAPLRRIKYADRNPDGEIVKPANCHCPIAASIVDYIVTKFNYEHKATFARNNLPECVVNWISDFDTSWQQAYDKKVAADA